MEQEARPYPRQRHDRADALASVDRYQALIDRLEAAVGAIQDSDSFRRYLDIQARFHRYSWANTVLIVAQYPAATRVAGYRTWQALGRQVRKGEHGIRIIVPLTGRQRRDEPPPIPATTADDADRDVLPLRFGTGTIFDISQTEGDPLPDVAVPVLEDDAGDTLYDDLARLAARDAVRVDRVPELPGSTMGWYDPVRRRIVVREAAQLQMTKTLAHELAHHVTGLHETYDAEREAHETIAESVAYITLAHYGLDSGARSFPYIATWARDRQTLTAALGTISRVSRTIITGLTAPQGPDSASEEGAPS